jgi:hypothetical protein
MRNKPVTSHFYLYLEYLHEVEEQNERYEEQQKRYEQRQERLKRKKANVVKLVADDNAKPKTPA